MANTQVSTTKNFSCWCDKHSDAGLIFGVVSIEYNDSIYVYKEGDTPADAISAMARSGMIPNKKSFERMIQQIKTTIVDNENKPTSTALEYIEDVESVQNNNIIPASTTR